MAATDNSVALVAASATAPRRGGSKMQPPCAAVRYPPRLVASYANAVFYYT